MRVLYCRVETRATGEERMRDWKGGEGMVMAEWDRIDVSKRGGGLVRICDGDGDGDNII